MSDHRAESERIMSLLNENVIAIEGQTDATMIATAIDALRHATLYAADQQRIANVMALESMPTEQFDRLSVNTSVTAIREGLGL